MLFFDEADGFPDREEEKARKEREAAVAEQEIEWQRKLQEMKEVQPTIYSTAVTIYHKC